MSNNDLKNEGAKVAEPKPAERLANLETQLGTVLEEQSRLRQRSEALAEENKRLKKRQEVLEKRDDPHEISSAEVIVGKDDIEKYLAQPEPDSSLYFIAYTPKGIDSLSKVVQIPIIPDSEVATTQYVSEKKRAAVLDFGKPCHMMLRDGPYCVLRADFTEISECMITPEDIAMSEEAWAGKRKDFPRLPLNVQPKNGIYTVAELFHHMRLRISSPDIRSKTTTFIINPWDPTSKTMIRKFLMGPEFQDLARAYYEERLHRNDMPAATVLRIQNIASPPKPVALTPEQRRDIARQNAAGLGV